MDIFSFVEGLVGSIAWPAALIISIHLLRDDILRILPSIRKIKAGPVEAEFESKIVELRFDEGASGGGEKLVSHKESLVVMARTNSAAAILSAWHEVKIAASLLYEKRFGLPATGEDMSNTIEKFIHAGLLTEEWLPRYRKLATLNAMVVGAPDFQPPFSSAVAFIELSSRLAAILTAARVSQN